MVRTFITEKNGKIRHNLDLQGQENPISGILVPNQFPDWEFNLENVNIPSCINTLPGCIFKVSFVHNL